MGARNKVIDMLNDAKKEHFKVEISKNEGDQKALFRIVNELLNKKKVSVFPDHNSTAELSERFSDFFESKIAKIRADLESLQSQASEFTEQPHANLVLSLQSFTTVSEIEVEKLRAAFKVKCPKLECQESPIGKLSAQAATV